MIKSVLIVEDDKLVRRSIVNALRRRFNVTSAPSAQPARALLQVHNFDAVVSDYQLHDGTGLELLRWLYTHAPKTRRIMICAQRPALTPDDERHVVQSLLIKPCGVPVLVAAIAETH